MSKQKTQDKRMAWILRFDELERAEGEKEHFTEYETCSEVRMPGVFTYGNEMLHCSLYQEADENGLYTYLLRIKNVEKIFEYDEESFSKDGYYFEKGLIGEILAILSFYFQARFYLKAEVLIFGDIKSRREHKLRYRKIDGLKCVNYEMLSDQKRNWSDAGLVQFFESIRNLGQEHHQKLIQAFNWYSEAIKELGIDHELFFIKMVSAVENLLKDIKTPDDSLKVKLLELKEDKFFTKKEGTDVDNWLENRGIIKRFLGFFDKYSAGYFKAGFRKAAHCYIRKKDSEEYLKRIYNARSKYLHEGKPMYLSLNMCHKESWKWDVDPSGGMGVDRRKIPGKEKLPHVRWFERIANHSIKNFIEEKLKEK